MSVRFCEWAWSDEAASIARCKHCGATMHVSSLRTVRNCRAAQAPAAPAATSTDCIHRGDVLRAVECATCKNSTIEVPVYACALFGECTIRSFAARNPALKETHVCTGCDRRQASGVRDQAPDARRLTPDASPPPLPNLATRAKNYAGAMVRDRLSGKLRRSPELVARLFDDFCARCPAYNAIEGACADCGCPVSPSEPEHNKLAWSTEHCPRGKFPIQRANLIFYLLPLRNSANVWQWHVEQLRARLSIFNGRKIVWIATKGPETKLSLDAPEKVIDAFGADAASIEFVTAANDPRNWETPALRAMLRALHAGEPVVSVGNGLCAVPPGGLSPDDCKLQIANCKLQNEAQAEATFYFHAKGVRRANQEAIRPWCEAIYHHNLDRWPEVRQILSVWPCAGVARQPFGPVNQVDTSWPRHELWHYAGTGFWFNHAALFARPHWNEIKDHSHAVEGYLGTQFPFEAAYCLAHDRAGVNAAGVYAPSTWVTPRGNASPPAISPAGASREAPADLELWILGHERERLHWATELPWVRKIYLPDIDPRNDLAESRIFERLQASGIGHQAPDARRLTPDASERPRASGISDQAPDARRLTPDASYIGLCTNSWDRKYAAHCLPLAELDRLERRPDLVWAACRTPPDWVEVSERDHKGMAAVIYTLAGHLGLTDADLRRPSLWSNNLIAHRDVLLDLARWHRELLPWCLDRWGWQPPYDVSGYDRRRHFSYLAERLTVLYFLTRPDLQIEQIPRHQASGSERHQASGVRHQAPDARRPHAFLLTPDARRLTPLSSRVVTAADAGFFFALQLFVLSLQATHECRLTVYDCGLRAEQLAWLAARGVAVDPWPLAQLADKQVHCQWLKAGMIAHSSHHAPRDVSHSSHHAPRDVSHSSHHAPRDESPAVASPADSRVLWIDADTIIAGSLSPLEEIAATKPFVTPCYAAAIFWGAGRERDCLANDDALYDRHPVPARLDRDWPNAGVVAIDGRRDRELLDAWVWMSDQAIADPTLRPLLKFRDQGAFQWAVEKLGLLDLMTPDKRFNDCDLQGEKSAADLSAAIAAKIARDDARIIHFAGNTKPYAGLLK